MVPSADTLGTRHRREGNCPPSRRPGHHILLPWDQELPENRGNRCSRFLVHHGRQTYYPSPSLKNLSSSLSTISTDCERYPEFWSLLNAPPNTSLALLLSVVNIRIMDEEGGLVLTYSLAVVPAGYIIFITSRMSLMEILD